MRLARLLVATAPLLMLLAESAPSYAFRSRAMKEARGIPTESLNPPCPLNPNLNGTCACPYTIVCDPVGTPRSFYYGTDQHPVCLPWINFSPTGRNDIFLYYLIIDGTPNPSPFEATT